MNYAHNHLLSPDSACCYHTDREVIEGSLYINYKIRITDDWQTIDVPINGFFDFPYGYGSTDYQTGVIYIHWSEIPDNLRVLASYGFYRDLRDLRDLPDCLIPDYIPVNWNKEGF